MSGSALIALAADELVMNEDAVLGAVEPMVGQFPAASIERVLAQKKLASVEDKTWVLADDARKERDQLKAKLKTALTRRGRMTDDDGERIASLLTSGRCTPDYPISVEELKEIGLVISTEIPLEIYQFMNLFPQIKTNRPSVDFVPTPHH